MISGVRKQRRGGSGGEMQDVEGRKRGAGREAHERALNASMLWMQHGRHARCCCKQPPKAAYTCEQALSQGLRACVLDV